MSLDDFEFAMYGGPWTICSHYLTIRPWMPEFDTEQDNLRSLLVWIRIPCLSIEYYYPEFLERVESKIGKLVKVDSATSMASRGHFARMFVEVDLTKPLLCKFRLRRRITRVEYEGVHLICFSCGMYDLREEERTVRQTR